MPTGPLPLVILSHGGLRSADDSGAWLAAGLAETGAVVVEVSAPRIETGVEAAAEIAARPGDISRAVDVMLNHAGWAERVDTDRIAVVGFALGGTAALAVAGAEVDAAAIAGACAPGGMGSPDCDWLAGQGASLEAFALAEAQDGRFGRAVAIAPEYAGALDGADVPMRVVTLNDGLTLFDAFPVCTGRAPEILGEGAVICGASDEARRAAHERISGAVSGFLAETWD
ncbi:alpha/beta hydrolase family protein [Amaricoccus tamworthensis]|uniref:alpha/beta hydrolase family protein n=1 Tax=Amaricoccus tamworthensis TaxID=57002 RepID=UPI003C797C2F